MITRTDLGTMRKEGLENILSSRPWISVGMGTCGIGNGADEVYAELGKTIVSSHLSASLRRVGCFGFCAAEPLVMAYRPGNQFYSLPM